MTMQVPLLIKTHEFSDEIMHKIFEEFSRNFGSKIQLFFSTHLGFFWLISPIVKSKTLLCFLTPTFQSLSDISQRFCWFIIEDYLSRRTLRNFIKNSSRSSSRDCFANFYEDSFENYPRDPDILTAFNFRISRLQNSYRSFSRNFLKKSYIPSEIFF